MFRLSALRITLGVAVLACASGKVAAQQLRELTVALPSRTGDDAAWRPSPLAVTAVAMGAGSFFAVGYGSAGNFVERVICERRHGDEQGPLFFGPCFAVAGGPTAIGWFGGALVGATAGAAVLAYRRGCPGRTAAWRAFAGAALGVAPGVAVVARRPEKYPPRRSALIFGAPLIAGAGAAAAVMSCHR